MESRHRILSGHGQRRRGRCAPCWENASQRRPWCGYRTSDASDASSATRNGELAVLGVLVVGRRRAACRIVRPAEIWIRRTANERAAGHLRFASALSKVSKGRSDRGVAEREREKNAETAWCLAGVRPTLPAQVANEMLVLPAPVVLGLSTLSLVHELHRGIWLLWRPCQWSGGARGRNARRRAC